MIRFDKKWFNPLYFILNEIKKDDNIRIVLVYGGKSSSKTASITQFLIKELVCYQNNSIAFRKESSSIPSTLKKSFQLAKKTTRLYPAVTEFDRKYVADNGGEIVLKGIDNEEKAKGIESYKYLFLDELNQFEEGEWDQFRMSLRGLKGQKIFAAWNPISINSWVKTKLVDKYNFIDHETWKLPSDQSFVKISEDGRIVLIRTVYQDNFWINGSPCGTYGFKDEALINEYEELKIRNYNKYLVNVIGEWGTPENESPFILTFDRTKHLAPKLERDKTLPIYLSWDFNRNPMCVSVIQTSGKKVRWLEVIKQPNTTIYRVLDYIKVKYPKAMFIVVGDYSGTTKQAIVKDQDESDYFSIIQAELGLSDGQMQQMPNPRIINNQVLVNYCLANLDVLHDERYCQPLIFDYENAQILADGTLKKTKREDPTQQLDALDTARYFYNNVFKGIDL